MLRVVETFSGIGSQAKALKKLGIDFIQTIRGAGYKVDKEN